jgi:UrcA family protein
MTRFAPQIRRAPRAPRALAALAAPAAAVVLAAAAFLGSPTPATAAQPAAAVPRATLYYSPHDLATDRGTRALYARIVAAAQSVCPGWDSRDLGAVAASRECQRDAVARAIGQIGNARLAAAHAHAIARHG